MSIGSVIKEVNEKFMVGVGARQPALTGLSLERPCSDFQPTRFERNPDPKTWFRVATNGHQFRVEYRCHPDGSWVPAAEIFPGGLYEFLDVRVHSSYGDAVAQRDALIKGIIEEKEKERIAKLPWVPVDPTDTTGARIRAERNSPWH